MHFAWFTQKNPQLRQAVEGEADMQGDSANWNQALKMAKWDSTACARRKNFRRTRLPNVPHSDQFSRPDLAGVTGRFSAEDLFTANHLSESRCRAANRTTAFKTRTARRTTALSLSNRPDGAIVLTGAAAPRLAEADIVARYPGNLSRCPADYPMGFA